MHRSRVPFRNVFYSPLGSKLLKFRNWKKWKTVLLYWIVLFTIQYSQIWQCHLLVMDKQQNEKFCRQECRSTWWLTNSIDVYKILSSNIWVTKESVQHQNISCIKFLLYFKQLYFNQNSFASVEILRAGPNWNGTGHLCKSKLWKDQSKNIWSRRASKRRNWKFRKNNFHVHLASSEKPGQIWRAGDKYE